MALENFKPTIWTAKIMRTLEDNMVARQICNLSAEGQIKSAGDAVKFSGIADPTVTAYTGTVTYEDMQDASTTMYINKQNYFAFKIDDVDKAQANIDAKGSQAERAGYMLKKAADTFVLGQYAQAGTIATAASVTSVNVLSTVSELVRRLEDQNVYAKERRWAVIPPWMKQKLMLAGVKFQIKNGSGAADGVAWSDELDINLYVSNQLYNSGTVAAPVHYVLAGSDQAIGYADQIVETEAIRLESQMATGVRGLHLYGTKVIKPMELVYCVCTFAADSTI